MTLKVFRGCWSTLNSCVDQTQTLLSWRLELTNRVGKCVPASARNQVFSIFDARALGGDVRLFGHLQARYTASAIDADRHVTLDRGPTYDAMLVSVIVDRVMLCCAVIPYRNIAL